MTDAWQSFRRNPALFVVISIDARAVEVWCKAWLIRTAGASVCEAPLFFMISLVQSHSRTRGRQ